MQTDKIEEMPEMVEITFTYAMFNNIKAQAIRYIFDVITCPKDKFYFNTGEYTI